MPRVNKVLLNSIPIDRKVKRYWISKYERVTRNCGPDEAVRKFKNLRNVVLRYLSDKDRRSNLRSYLSSTGFRNNGMLRKLFEQADCQPHFVLSFLKLYSSTTDSAKSDEEIMESTHERLEAVKANVAVPHYLEAWLEIIFSTKRSWSKEWTVARSNPNHPFHRAASLHTIKEWCAYWRKWNSILRGGWKSTDNLSVDSKQVFPEIYKDYAIAYQTSRSYDRDFVELVAMHYLDFGVRPLNARQLAFVDSFLNEDVASILQYNPAEISSHYSSLNIESSLLGMAVGQVQHIAKKGGGTEKRDIAVPNRFIQAALEPAAARLYNLVRELPQDCTFNQSAFDTRIQNRVNNSCLYAGSVDLSKATDNLPMNWGRKIIDRIHEHWVAGLEGNWKCPDGNGGWIRGSTLWSSLDLFWTVSNSLWEDTEVFDRWKVGQPLGSLPSFALLAITHNLLVESMGCSRGLLHSPYVILGDDIVIFNKKLRAKYISEMTSRGVPLSLHKSFDGRLTEFAGKTYVHGCVPFHTSDHSPITYASLFDWQRATGIRIPWSELPLDLRKKIQVRAFRVVTEEMGPGNPIPQELVRRIGVSSYNLAQCCEVLGAGSILYQIDRMMTDELLELYFTYVEINRENGQPPEGLKHSGITLLANQYPVTLMGEQYADHDGWFHRFRPVSLPKWYKDKYRPCSTDAVIRSAAQAWLAFRTNQVTA